MISVLLGAAAALCWGLQNVLLARSARAVNPATVAAQYVGYGSILAFPFAFAIALVHPPQADQIALIVVGGLAQGSGLVCFTGALSRGGVGVMTGLLSLEGAVAAVLSIVAGESLDVDVIAGLAIASAGGVALIATPADNLPPSAIRLILLAVGANGIALWLLGAADLDLASTLFVFNATSFAAIWSYQRLRGDPVSLRERDSRPWLLFAAAALGTLGVAAFAVGARGGSTAVTAVMAAQFASVAAIGGFVAFGERMGRRQILGFVALVVGVSVVAATSG